MAIAFVQSTVVAAATGFSSITTSAITTTSGNFLVAHIANYTAQSSLTDSNSNTWTNVAAFSTGSGFIRMDYVANCVGGAAHTFTASGGNYPAITVQEFSGVAASSPLDASGTDFTSGGAASHPVSCTTTNANDVIVGGGSSSNSTSFAVSSPFTQDRVLDTGTFEGIATGYNIVSSAGSQTFTITTTNTGCTTRSIIAGFKAAVSGGSTITPGVGALTLTGIAPTLAVPISRTPTVGALTLTGVAPSLRTDFRLTPNVGALTLTGVAPSLLQATLRAPTVGTLTLTGVAPTLLTDFRLTAGAGTLTLTGIAPTVVQGSPGNTNIVPGTGSLTFTGLAPSLLASVTITPSAGSLTLTGVASTLMTGVFRQPTTGALTVTGIAPTVSTVGNTSITPAVGALNLTGLSPSVRVPVLIRPGAGALNLVGQAAVITGQGTIRQPATGTLTLTGYAPIVNIGNVVIIVKMFGVNIGHPYLLVFLSDGSAYAYRVDTGVSSLIAAAGTFSNTGPGDVAVWEGSVVLIIDPATGYWRWPGSGIGSSAPSAEIIPAPLIGIAAAGAVEAGAHSWAITFFRGSEGALGAQSTATILGVASSVQLSGIPIGPTGTTARNVYRTKANQPGVYQLVATIADNTTTTYLDNTPDGSLGAVSPAPGAVDAGGHQYAIAFSDGVTTSALSDASPILNTAVAGTVIVFNLALGPVGTTQRFVYRTSVAQPSTFQQVALIADNFNTSFNDIVPDSALGAVFNGDAGIAVSLIDSTKVGTTIAVFAGRAWIANNRTVQFSAPNNYADFSILDAAGSFVMTDSSFVGPIQKLLAALDALWIYGEAAINQLTNVTILPDTTTTTFSNVNVSASLGTTFPQSVVSFLRQIEFASRYGIIQQVGVSPQRISEKIDGTYSLLDLTQPVTAGLVVLNEILCYGLMVTYNDPDNRGAPRKIILCVTFDGKWFIGSQGDTLIRMASVEHNGTYRMFGADEFVIRELFVQPHYPIHKLKTPFFDGGDITAGKEMVRTMMIMNFPEATPITSTITPQAALGAKNPLDADKSNVLQLYPGQGANVTVLGQDGATLEIVGQGFQLQQWYTALNSKLVAFDMSFNSDPFHIAGYAMDVITRESWGDS